MRSLVRAFSVAVLGILLSAQLALAKAPSREPFIQEPVTFAAGEVCSFQLRLENVRGGQTLTTFANGVVKITGSVWTRVTNVDAGKSITVNASGPATITPNADGTVALKATGRFLFFFFPGEIGPGRDGALLLTTGLALETLSADFSRIISFSHPNGTTEDLCQTLLR
jgi:hypothetical protein